MTEISDQDLLTWIKGQRYSKTLWIERVSTGRNRRPDHEIRQKKIDVVMLDEIEARIRAAQKDGRGGSI